MKKDRFNFWAAMIGSLVFIVGMLILLGYSKSAGFHFVHWNILSGMYALLSMVAVFALRKQKGFLGKILILTNCVLSFGQLYFLDFRRYHQLIFVLFAVSVLYLVYGLVSFFLRRRKEPWYNTIHLVMYVLAPCFVGFSLFIKSALLMKLIETDVNAVIGVVGLISLVCGAVALIIAIVLIKDRQDKKEYFGKLAASFCLTWLLTFAVPMLMSEYLNYVLDTSEAVKTQCVVVGKEIRNTVGKGGPRYYLIVSADGETEELNTHKVIYEQYAEGDPIELYAHTGALGFDYYEYRFDDIYHYNQE